jgi:hypothetical protein
MLGCETRAVCLGCETRAVWLGCATHAVWLGCVTCAVCRNYIAKLMDQVKQGITFSHLDKSGEEQSEHVAPSTDDVRQAQDFALTFSPAVLKVRSRTANRPHACNVALHTGWLASADCGAAGRLCSILCSIRTRLLLPSQQEPWAACSVSPTRTMLLLPVRARPLLAAAGRCTRCACRGCHS